MDKHPAAKQLASNLKNQFEIYKKAAGESCNICPCCGQSLANTLTQEWLGEQCGMSKATIVHYFQGNRMPSIVNIAKLARALNCEFIDLLKDINLDLFE